MTIDFDRIKQLAERPAAEPLTEVLVDPLADLSPEAQEQALRDQSANARKDKRDAARAELQQKQLEREIRNAREMQEDIDSFYSSKKYAQGIRLMGGAIVAQLSDVHFGCVVRGMEERQDANEWDFSIAARRLRALAEHVKFYGVAHRAEEVVVALTGDIFDSKIGKERYDKMLNSEGAACYTFSRGKDLVIQFINDLAESEVFPRVRVTGIAGNEARLFADRGHSHVMSADNWDSALNAELASYYRGSDVECEFGVNRKVLEIQGHRMLMIHGDQGRFNPTNQTAVQSLLGQHDATFGISGHIHDTLVTGKWARSSSVMGTDFYAGDGLGLDGIAAQNVMWLAPGQRNTYAIDLQNPDPGLEPYELFDYGGAYGSAET
ncbi:MAG: hypothetical protein CL959_01770 [Euryarchaeota archaeon]|nr:hypothetical protein [Euryarchaeota archaeon]|tara:strand:- start:635 stop:1771 length:1137 start_codon:yes stop_codon:yes gene_type:complete